MYFNCMDMFDARREHLIAKNAPLADRMRPRTLDEFVGQDHIIGQGRLLRRAIQIDQLSSVIFYGPPGTGKTTLARIIAATTKAQFLSINAVLAGIKEIRDSIDTAKECLSLYGKRTILFIDEVHRFNKAQQDALLPHVENGILILIGATTENPYFEVNKALVSRSRIFQLKTLNHDDLVTIAKMTLSDKERGYGNLNVSIDDDAIDHLAQVANGDARGILNAIELAVETTASDESGRIHITRRIAEESIQQKAVLYDKDGDAHYDTISAFIKSVRGSDPDAALYWMAKMVYAGEDPRFIFRRMLILACEDVGLADPHALSVVMDAARAFDYVGMPEGRYHLAHACLYLSTAPKSNSSMAFFDALSQVSQETKDDVPNHLADASRDKEGFGHGQGYLYPHAFRDHWVAQQYLPTSLQGKVFYQPSTVGYENEINLRVTRFREAMVEAMTNRQNQDDIFGDAEKGTSKQQWIARTHSDESLGRIRDAIFSLANIQRDGMVLDVHCRTGLLTFEAMRRTPQGSVWACAHDNAEFETVEKMAANYDALIRPQIIKTSNAGFDTDIKKAAGNNVAFDIILGQSAMSSEPDKFAFISRASELLSKDGCMVFSEPLHSQGQRLSEFLDLGSLGSPIAEAFLRAENTLFSQTSDPLVNWSAEDIEKQCRDTDRFKCTVQRMASNCKRRIGSETVDFWFRPSESGHRLSLGAHLRTIVSKNEVERIRRHIHAKIDNKDLQWSTVTVFLKISFA